MTEPTGGEQRTYFRDARQHFSLLRSGPLPVRVAQLGALHALGAHFSLRSSPALIALLTGVGKTVVAAAAPFIVADTNRVLYIVPTKVLRQDAVANLRSQRQLREVNLLDDVAGDPMVIEVDKRPNGWDDFYSCDVAVALPNALFELVESDPPPRDLFDVIVFDEAHHVPSRTWTLIEQAFDARAVMLTATPYRRDAVELPGELIYSYPLSRAIDDGAYVPIELVGVEAIGLTERDRDVAIATRAVEVLRGDQHSGTDSRLLVRASTKDRVHDLARIYETLGVTIHVVHSSLTPPTVEKRVREVRDGEVDGIAFVGVLGEGFDCPQLKVGAYHDKHKSLPVTLQFLGRLSRVCDSAGPPQVVASVETLKNDTWALWRRNSDWTSIVPALAETANDNVARRKQLVAEMDSFPRGEVALADVALRPAVGLYEVHPTLQLAGGDDSCAEFGLEATDVAEAGIAVGESFGGGSIVWSHVNAAEQLLLFATSHIERPDWLRSSALDSERFEMHAALVRKQIDGTPLVVVSSTSRSREAEIMKLMTGDADNFQLATPEFMRRFLSAAEIGNVQHLGSRNAAGGSQARTYTTNSGRAVEDGIAYDDLSEDVIGHVGAQCHINGEDYNGGVSITNSRLWINKGFEIDRFIDFFDDLLTRMGAGQPGEIRRLAARFEQHLVAWPTDTDVIAVVLGEYFLQHVNDIAGRHPADTNITATPIAGDRLRLEIEHADWFGELRPNGTFVSTSGDFQVETTAGDEWLESLLVQYPPSVYFRDGSSTLGQRLVPRSPRVASPPLADILDSTWNWSTTNIRHETKRSGTTDSIHQKVEDELCAQYPSAWIIADDGSGEIADHIVLDECESSLCVRLVHSKASEEDSAGLRTGDLDELVAQIVRSKRWLALGDRAFWQRFATRIRQRASTVVIQSPPGLGPDDLIDACGNWSETPPIITTEYIGIQPGLDADRLAADYKADPAAHPRMAETIGACAAWVGGANSSLRLVGG